MADAALADRIDAVLPQTQCTRCGFAACRPYAEALAAGEADLDRCPPGGPATIAALADLTSRPVRPLDPARGAHGPRLAAVIDEARCIGCTLCIDACPVDAILGAAKRLHAVVSSLCSGCELCLAPCPVDCIAMVPASAPWTVDDANAARVRHRQRSERLVRGERIAQRGQLAPPDGDDPVARQAAVAAALVRARERRARAMTRNP
jgi:electron transport complex protein RnfB